MSGTVPKFGEGMGLPGGLPSLGGGGGVECKDTICLDHQRKYCGFQLLGVQEA